MTYNFKYKKGDVLSCDWEHNGVQKNTTFTVGRRLIDVDEEGIYRHTYFDEEKMVHFYAEHVDQRYTKVN